MHGFSRSLALMAAVLLACLGLSLPSARADEIALDIRTLVDPGGALSFEQVLGMDAAQFTPAARSDINFGYTRDTIWLRLAITSPADRAAILTLTPNFVDEIDIHVARDATASAPGDFALVSTGDHRPIPADGLSGLDDAVELDLRAGQTRLVYIRLASTGSSLTTEVQVYPREDWPSRQTAFLLVAGAWFGGMAILGIVQLVFFHYDRKPANLLLAIATAMVAVVYLGTLGVSRALWFAQGGTGNDVFVAVSIWLSAIASSVAAIHILELRENSPLLHRIFIAFAGIAAVGVVFGLLGQHLVFAPFGSFASIGLATLGAVQGLRTANAGGAATWLRAAAYLALWVGIVANMAQRTALFDLPVWVTHSYAVACLVQTVLLTAALGVRLRAAENLNIAMQAQALAAAQTAEEQARRLVEDRTRELVAARRTAEDALSAELASQQQQVRFMEVISHQYRTPLAAIRTHVDNIGLSLPPEDEANRTRLERVRKGIQRLVEVLEVNLSRARLQGPSFQPVLARASAPDIVEAAAARGRDLLQSPILTEIAGDGPMRIKADAEMLGLAIVNLLENAVKYSRPKTRAPVLLACRQEAGTIAITVTDEGIGIPADEIGSAFGPAWRGSNALGIEGTGTGLSLVARIVSAHGGRVDIQSIEGQGTTVTLCLPALKG